jgi:hypothetical protein
MLATNEFETQFAHLSPEEQLALLERLVHQMRSGAPLNGHGREPNGVAVTETADPRFRREWDRITVDFKAAGADLLSEA